MFLLGPPLGTGCSIDKPKGTKISLQTDSIYLGSSENSWQPQLTQSTIPCLVARKVWCSRSRGAHTHTPISTPTNTHAQLPSTLPRTLTFSLRHVLVTGYAHIPLHINVYLRCTHNFTAHGLRRPYSPSPLPHGLSLCPQVILAHMHTHTNGIRILEVVAGLEVNWFSILISYVRKQGFREGKPPAQGHTGS